MFNIERNVENEVKAEDCKSKEMDSQRSEGGVPILRKSEIDLFSWRKSEI